jgi:hypothetical protein
MYDRENREMVRTYREMLYGPGVFTREDDQLLVDGVPVSEVVDFHIDRRDAEFFSENPGDDRNEDNVESGDPPDS